MSKAVSAARRDLLERYEGASRRSVEFGLDRYLDWCARTDLDALKAKRRNIEEFSHWLREECGLKRSTTSGYLSSVSMFYRLADADGRIKKNPMLMVRRPKVHYDEDRMRGLTRHDVEKFILAAANRSPQHLALAMLLASCGLRASEVAGIRIEDFAGYRGGHRVLTLVRKGGKPRTMPLPPLVLRPLEAAAAGRTSGYLLTTRTGRQMTRHDIYRRVEVLGRQAGLGHVHPHMLRHSAITILLDAGASLRRVQNFSDHATIRTVEKYDRTRGSLDAHAIYFMQMHLSSISEQLAS